jgi:hypothetical protein
MSLKDVVLGMRAAAVQQYAQELDWGEVPSLRFEEVEAITGLPAFAPVFEGKEFPKQPANRDISAWLPQLEKLIGRAASIVHTHRFEDEFLTVREYCDHYGDSI